MRRVDLRKSKELFEDLAQIIKEAKQAKSIEISKRIKSSIC